MTRCAGGVERGAQGGKGKAVVFGMLEHDGDLVAEVVPDGRSGTLLPIIRDNIRRHTIVHTDEHKAYGGLPTMGYFHETTNHSLGEYVSPKGSSVNGIESFWSHLKR